MMNPPRGQSTRGPKDPSRPTLRQEAENRVVLQIQKLSDNNTHLARINNRLNAEIERLRNEYDSLEHLSNGHLAVCKAKENELAKEIQELKHILKDSLAEREELRSKLLAKEEIVRYLEWRLAQAQTATPFLPSSLSAAFRAGNTAANGLPPEDSFFILTEGQQSSANSAAASVSEPNAQLGRQGLVDPSTLLALGQRGMIGIPVAAWLRDEAQQDKENAEVQRTPVQRTGLPATPLTGRAALADITPTSVAAGGASGSTRGDTSFRVMLTHTTVEGESIGRQQRVFPSSQDDHNDDDRPENEREHQTLEHTTPLLREDSSVASIGAAGALKELAVSLITPPPSAHEDYSPLLGQPHSSNTHGQSTTTNIIIQVTPGSRIRSSRSRRRISYALPTLNSKLRQGDPFTFGESSAFKKKTSGSRTRTKPRVKHPAVAASSSSSRKSKLSRATTPLFGYEEEKDGKTNTSAS